MRIGCVTFFDPHGPGETPGLAHPYGIEALADFGFELVHIPNDWSAPRPRRDIRVLRQLNRQLDEIDIILAMFEPQANAVALARSLHLTRARSVPMVTIVCWLAEEALHASRTRRQLLGLAYRSVDQVVVFSSNQIEVLGRELSIKPQHVARVSFGCDVNWFAETDDDTSNVGAPYVVAVGRDRGRDWRTLFHAIAGTGVRLVVACRPSQVRGLAVPAEVEFVGEVDRLTYRRLLRDSTAVVVPLVERAYPSGQSVLLESMAMGKCVIAAATASLEEYLRPEHTVLTYGPGDSAALRAQILRAFNSPELRRRVGVAAAYEARERYRSEQMWAEVARVLVNVADVGRAPHGHQLPRGPGPDTSATAESG